MNKRPYIKIVIRTLEDTKPESFGRELFNILWENYPLLEPQYFGPYVRMSRYTDLDDLMSFWPHHINSWKRNKKIKNWGSLRHPAESIGGLNPGHFVFSCLFDPQVDWENMFDRLCNHFKPQLGMMHLYTEYECQLNYTIKQFKDANFGALRDPKIPGLGWKFAAGHEFYTRTMVPKLDDIGVERIDYGKYCILRIAKSAAEIIQDYSVFDVRRNRLIERFPIISFTEPSPSIKRMLKPPVLN